MSCPWCKNKEVSEDSKVCTVCKGGEYIPLTLEKLKEELEPFKNTLVLNFNEVVRLVDASEDEMDFYWVYDTRKDGIIHSSCVCGWTPLKKYIPEQEYKNLVHVWNLNTLNPYAV